MATHNPPELSLISFSIASAVAEACYEPTEPDTTMPATTAPPPSPATVVHNWQTEHTVKKHPEHYYSQGDVKFLVRRLRSLYAELLLTMSVKIEDTLYQLHSDLLTQRSDWYRTYCENTVDQNDTLPVGWKALPGPFCTIYVHPSTERAQLERPRVVDEQTGAIVVEDVTIDEMDAFLAVLYPRSVAGRTVGR